MREPGNQDVRSDQGTAVQVDEGLHLCVRHGLDPALQFLEGVGVPREVALRVLCSPDHFRKRQRRKSPRPQR